MTEEAIEKLQDKLNNLVLQHDKLNDDIILRVSQELDKLITEYYVYERLNQA